MKSYRAEPFICIWRYHLSESASIECQDYSSWSFADAAGNAGHSICLMDLTRLESHVRCCLLMAASSHAAKEIHAVMQSVDASPALKQLRSCYEGIHDRVGQLYQRPSAWHSFTLHQDTSCCMMQGLDSLELSRSHFPSS